MRLLIGAAVAALTAIVLTFVMKKVDGPWREDSSIRTAIVGAVCGVVGMNVSRHLRQKE